MKVKVEYEPVRIRHIAVQCDKCFKWFRAQDVLKTDMELETEGDIYYAQYECPVCGHIFGFSSFNNFANDIIEECSYPEVYKDCLKKKIVWE